MISHMSSYDIEYFQKVALWKLTSLLIPVPSRTVLLHCNVPTNTVNRATMLEP